MIVRLRELLASLGLDSSPETIADLLWLAHRFAPADLAPGRPVEPAAEVVPELTDKAAKARLESLWTRFVYSADERPTQYYAAVPNPSARGIRSKAERVPAVRAVPDPLAVTRSLRPLKRREPSRWRSEVDIAATVTGIAETGVVDIVQRPEADRWLDLVLVVDDGLSMRLWRQTAEEIRMLMGRLGAFRTIHYHALDADSPQKVLIRSKPFDRSSAVRSLGTTIDPTGRTVVMVLTDGVSEGWRTGAAREALARWAANGPVAIIQPLPSRLWPGTKLGIDLLHLRSRTPAGPNRRVDVGHPLIPDQLLPAIQVPVPVLEATPASMRRWAHLVLGTDTTVRLPVLDAAAAFEQPGEEREEEAPKPEASGADLLRHFRAAASPEAYRLAATLAAVKPLTLPVMRIMQDAVPGVTRSHLAEVFLGGLLRRGEEADAYDFRSGVRPLLLDTLDIEETAELVRVVGARIRSWLGGGPDTPALRGDDSGGVWLHPDAEPFAVVDSSREEPGDVPDDATLRDRSGKPGPLRGTVSDRAVGTEVTLARMEIVADRYVAVDAVAVTRDGTRIVACTRSGRVQVWNIAHGAIERNFFGDFGFARVLTVGPNSLWVVSHGTVRDDSADTTHYVELWDFASVSLVHRHVVPGQRVTGAAVSPDGRRLAVGDYRGPVWIIDVHHPDAPPRMLTEHDRMVNALAFNADGSMLATGGYDGIVRLWDTSTGQLLQALVGHQTRVNTLAFSSDGSWIVTGANNETVRLWDTATGWQIGLLAGHDGWVSAVTVSPGNTWIATVGEDRKVRVWEAATGRQAALIDAEGECCAWTPDGSVLVVGGMFGLSLYRFHQ